MEKDTTRRQVLGLLGATAAVALAGFGRRSSVASATPSAATFACVVRPHQTEGPYFVDEKLNRSDIRSDPSDSSVRPGAQLRVALRVYRIDGGSCVPLPGSIVDLWQCDALGVYSDVKDGEGLFDARGKKFLRGYQVTDAKGVVEFLTIYPGWYPGRTVHIHFKIRTDAASRRGYEFTSQLYFDESLTDQVYAQALYAARGRRTTTNERDGIFRRGGNQLILPVVKDAEGYVGTFDIGLQMG